LVDFIPKTWIEGYSVPEFFSSIERYIASVYDSKGFQSISETSRLEFNSFFPRNSKNK